MLLNCDFGAKLFPFGDLYFGVQLFVAATGTSVLPEKKIIECEKKIEERREEDSQEGERKKERKKERKEGRKKERKYKNKVNKKSFQVISIKILEIPVTLFVW